MALTAGQLACIEMLDTPVAVSAGAGSGKTLTLTKRIVNSLQIGVAKSIDEVLAITYTDAAAAEIKGRVKNALMQANMGEEALKTDGAWISTIHGMCARILRDHAIELGIDPAFSVLDEAVSQTLLSAALEEVLASESKASPSDAYTTLFSEYSARVSGPYGTSVEKMLHELIDEAAAHPEGMDVFTTAPAPNLGESELRHMVDTAQLLVSYAEQEKPGKKRDTFIAETSSAIENATCLLDKRLSGNSESDTDHRHKKFQTACCMSVLSFPLPAKGFGSADGAYKQALDDLRPIYEHYIAEARLAIGAPSACELIELARKVLRTYAEHKRAIGALDNNDLIVLASHALDDHPDIAHAYRERFTVIMIDEFQDTDQLQVDIVKRIAGAGRDTICTVGDAQQSIYRFRGADLSVFRRRVQEIRQDNPDAMICLPDNFRSHSDILKFVDCVFSQPRVFGDEFMPLTAARDEVLVASPLQGDIPRIDIINIAYGRRTGGVNKARCVEAKEIARRFAQLRDEGQRAGDMTVLLGSMRHAQIYAHALRMQGFSCVITKGSVFNEAAEVKVMVYLAYAIANLLDTEALFNVLTSDMFHLTADDLLTLTTLGNDENPSERSQNLAEGLRRAIGQKVTVQISDTLSGADDVATPKTKFDPSPRLEIAICIFAKIQAKIGAYPLSRIMADAIRDSGWLSRLETQGAEGQAVAGNVFKALRIIEQIERDEPIGTLGTARRFNDTVEIAKEPPGALATTDGDFVRIMTVHASKGLEFPVVAVAELDHTPKSNGKLVTARMKGSVYVSLDAGTTLDHCTYHKSIGTLPSSGAFDGLDEDVLIELLEQSLSAAESRDIARALDAEAETQERKRLLYVALTRAKEALIIAMHGTLTDKHPSGIAPDDNGVWADIQAALMGSEKMFEPGVNERDYGGSHNARITTLQLADDIENEDAPDSGKNPLPTASKKTPANDTETTPEDGSDFAIYDPLVGDDKRDEPYNLLREHTFSYSSIAQTQSPDSIPNVKAPLQDESYKEAAPTCETQRTIRDSEESDNFSDADKATDLGCAFHRLAQYAVLTRDASGKLLCPPKERIEVIGAQAALSEQLRIRLSAALARWFDSSLAHELAHWRYLDAEVPFYIDLPFNAAQSAGASPVEAYLEGEIDLLATGYRENVSERVPEALIADYKTGGSCKETQETLFKKHRLQAMCYAYYLLRRGYRNVEAVFVRVEQSGAVPFSFDTAAHAALESDVTTGSADIAQTDEPQYVRYSFTAADLCTLENTLAEAYRRTD